jgi:hypothetical protein
MLAAALLGVALFGASARVLDPGLWPVRPRLSAADDAAVREAIDIFNRVYEDFYASGGRPAMIDEFPATRAVKHHVFRDIGFIRDAGLVQVQDLAAATIREVSRTGAGEATALVYEEWNYMLQRSEDRAPKSELKGEGQGFRYRLRKERGRWVIADWEVVELAAPPRKEGITW